MKAAADDADVMQRVEGVDAFTLLHHDLNICTNSVCPAATLSADFVFLLLLRG